MDVHVKQSTIEGAGRGLFASKDFAAGDVVVSLERPYVAELDTPRLKDTCAWCFRRGAATDATSANDPSAFFISAVETKACTGCHRVRYCSRSCQSKAWKREHKHECKVIAPDNRPDLPHGVRAVIKLLGKLKSDPEGKDERLLDILQFMPCGSGDLKAVDDFKKSQPGKFEDFSMLAYGAWKYSGEPKLGSMDSEMVAKALFFNVMSNTFQLSSPLDDTSLGSAFDTILCSTNHSCEPNVACLFNQPKTLLRALKPIKKGEEIYMRYCDITNPYSARQEQLHRQYQFHCKCSRCKKGANLPQDVYLKSPENLGAEFTKVADNLIKRHEKQLAQFLVPGNDELAQRRAAALEAEAFSVSGITFDFNSGNDTASADEIIDALKLCLNSGLWSYTRQPVPHLLRQLYGAYLAQGQAYQAWRIGIVRLFLVDSLVSPDPYDGQQAIDAWALATTTNLLCNPNTPENKEIFDECFRSGLELRLVYAGLLIKARECIAKSYGKDSPFGVVVEAIWDQMVQNTHLSPDEIKTRVKEIWPKLEAVARTVDVLKL